MKQQINIEPLPHMGSYVRNIMKQQQIDAKLLARKANMSRDNIYKLLRSGQWQLNNIDIIGRILNVNLFRLYVPEYNEKWPQEKQQLQTDIEALKQVNNSLIEKSNEINQAIQQLQQEKQWMEKENELLREVSGLKRAS